MPVTGILAAAGPGISSADVPEGADITQIPATLLALHGLEAPLDSSPIESILIPSSTRARQPAGAVPQDPLERPGYTREEEDMIVQRLRDLGYE